MIACMAIIVSILKLSSACIKYQGIFFHVHNIMLPAVYTIIVLSNVLIILVLRICYVPELTLASSYLLSILFNIYYINLYACRIVQYIHGIFGNIYKK